MADIDWGMWSREATALMQRRNREWQASWQLAPGSPYRWELDPPELVFQRDADEVVADLTVVGTCSEDAGTFLWGWANDSMPEVSLSGLDGVRAFGEEHGLNMLVEAEWKAGLPESLEALTIAGRLLDADGVFADSIDDVTIYFALKSFRSRPSPR